MMATHNVNVTLGSVVRSNSVNFPHAPAAFSPAPMVKNADAPPWILQTIQTNASVPPRVKRANCITSVQITVRIPPISVQTIANTPIAQMQLANVHGVTTSKARAATRTRTDCPRMLPTEKITVASRFTPSPSRFSM